MKLTTKGKYAVTALLDMALYGQSNGEFHPVTVESVAIRQGIPKMYLERLTGAMRAKGLLQSTKGPGGGYKLTRPTTQITIADIMTAIEEPVDMTTCKGSGNCQNGTQCLTHHLWDELNARIMDYLQSVTLYDLAQRPNIKTIVEAQQKRHLLTVV